VLCEGVKSAENAMRIEDSFEAQQELSSGGFDVDLGEFEMI
jgi:hypothetical protein